MGNSLPKRVIEAVLWRHPPGLVRETIEGLETAGLVECRRRRERVSIELTIDGLHAAANARRRLGVLPAESILDERSSDSVSVFFAWQSWNKPARNQIGSALERFVSAPPENWGLTRPIKLEIAADLDDGAARIDLLLLQKIKTCDLFIADLTPFAAKGATLVPNPNVLVETGYALAHLKAEQMILIVSDSAVAGLHPSSDGRFPFDIDHLRRIHYTRPADLRAKLGRELHARLRSMGLAK